MNGEDFYSNNSASFQNYNNYEDSNSYTLNFFDDNGNSIKTIYLSEDCFEEDRIENQKLSSEIAFFSLILTYKNLDGSIRFYNLCYFCLENRVKVINPKFISLKNGEEIYGEFRMFETLNQLNMICNFIIESFYNRNLPMQGDYSLVTKELEFIKNYMIK